MHYYSTKRASFLGLVAEELHQLCFVAASLHLVEERSELLVIESQRRPRWGGVRRG
jgi:hypothetical protein